MNDLKDRITEFARSKPGAFLAAAAAAGFVLGRLLRGSSGDDSDEEWS